MEWVVLVGNGVLIAVIVWFGIFIKKYMAKKGEIEALNENFTTLLKQTAETTAVTKNIESKISNDAWVIQQKWQIKKDFYIETLELYNTINVCLGGWIDNEKKLIEESIDPDKAHELENEKDIAFDITHSTMQKLQTKVDLMGVLFLDQEVLKSIEVFTKAEHRRKQNLELDYLVAEASNNRTDMIDAAEQMVNLNCYMPHLYDEFTKSYELFLASARKDLNLTLNG